jgi:hypothetical protein
MAIAVLIIIVVEISLAVASMVITRRKTAIESKRLHRPLRELDRQQAERADVANGSRPIPEPTATAPRTSWRPSMTSSSPSQHDNWRLGDQLTQIEDEMLEAAAAGKQVDRAAVAAIEDWGPDRTIRAPVLRYLLAVVDWPVHAKGVHLRGVRISGQLDLEATALRCPLRLEHCYFPAPVPVNFDYASASLLTLTNCHLAGLKGDGLVVTKDLDLTGSTFTSQLRLPGADITGQLICSGAKLSDGSGGDIVSALLSLLGGSIALNADNIRVGGDAFLDRVFATAGAVRLAGADIAGQLNCSGAQLTGANKQGNALVAFRMKVGGDVFLDEDVVLHEKFTAVGAVWLTGADITGQLNCSGAQLTGADKQGNTLVADGMKVGEHVILDEKFTAAGAVRLTGADITGQLRCHGAQLSAGPGSDGYALVADRLKVSGDVILDQGFTAAGAISLSSVRVDGSLRWEPSEPVAGLVSLEDAVIGELQDSWIGPGRTERHNGFWPAVHKGKLLLDGFTYARIGGAHPAKLEQRLAWLGSQRKRTADRTAERFATQPYEQLAKVYRQAGQDKEAREVAIARRRDLRWYGDLSRSGKFGNWLLDFTIRYGYKTWRAVAGIIVLYAAVLLFLWFARYHNAIIPVQTTTGLHPAPTAGSCSSHYPCFNPFGYAIDTVIPLINVHQADFWGPNESAGLWGTACVFVTYVGIGFGWAFATLAVAGYTGLARKIDAP